MCSALHHVEICVGEENNLINLLIRGFGFTLIARHLTLLSSKWVLKHGSAVFVITKRSKNYEHLNRVTDDLNDNIDQSKKPDEKAHLSSEFPLILDDTHSSDLEHWTVFCCQNQTSHITDSVFNVAIVVKNVDEVTKRVKTRGGHVLREPTIVKDSHGQVRYSIVSSCFGNIVHTLIDKQDYSGEFLPRFEKLKIDNYEAFLNCKREADDCPSSRVPSYVKENTIVNEFLQQTMTNYSNSYLNDYLNVEPLFTHVDHIAFACETGKSKEMMAWYEYCFGMERFTINREETEEGGFVLGENIGMRLKAMEYWMCAEVGLTMPSPRHEDSFLKVVIGEPLIGFEKSQIATFLQNNKGPGVQHIALHTPNMAPTVKHVSQQGITFRKAPPAYYQKGIRLEDIKAAGHGDELDLFQELGILLDIEDDVFCDMKDHQRKTKYLLQVFTTPIFQEDTFFLEVIHREGAKGFGVGNIRALAQSIIYDQQQQDQAKTCQSLTS